MSAACGGRGLLHLFSMIQNYGGLAIGIAIGIVIAWLYFLIWDSGTAPRFVKTRSNAAWP